ncbi:MAG: FAD-binding oxidoreductase [Thermomicrobiales bacterium]
MERGVRIFEGTPVIEVIEGKRPQVVTPAGDVTADKIAIATNAWAAGLQELRRSIIVLSSDHDASQRRLQANRCDRMDDGEAVTVRVMVHSVQVTNDGRIAIGRGSRALACTGQVTDAFNDPGQRAVDVERGLRRFYPTLGNVPISHRWAGAVDRSRTNTLVFRSWVAIVGRYGVGYSGTGVAPALIGGRILASSLLECDDEWSNTHLNRGAAILYPREPVPVTSAASSCVPRQASRKKMTNAEVESSGWISAFAGLAPARYPRRRSLILRIGYSAGGPSMIH